MYKIIFYHYYRSNQFISHSPNQSLASFFTSINQFPTFAFFFLGERGGGVGGPRKAKVGNWLMEVKKEARDWLGEWLMN